MMFSIRSLGLSEFEFCYVVLLLFSGVFIADCVFENVMIDVTAHRVKRVCR